MSEFRCYIEICWDVWQDFETSPSLCTSTGVTPMVRLYLSVPGKGLLVLSMSHGIAVPVGPEREAAQVSCADWAGMDYQRINHRTKWHGRAGLHRDPNRTQISVHGARLGAQTYLKENLHWKNRSALEKLIAWLSCQSTSFSTFWTGTWSLIRGPEFPLELACSRSMTPR